MREMRRNGRERLGPGPSGFDDIAGTNDPSGGLVTVSHGVYLESLPVAEMAVGEIRRRYADRFEIDPNSHAEVDGQPVGDDTVVRAGQLLLFANHAGEKGASSRPSRGEGGPATSITSRGEGGPATSITSRGEGGPATSITSKHPPESN